MNQLLNRRPWPLRAACAAVRTGVSSSPAARRAPSGGFVLEQAERRVLFAALSALPILHSHPQAQAKLFIDFDGNGPINEWLGFKVTATPAYDVDGDATTFTDAELDDIREIWARVAEAYSPFNIDVTTQDPGNRANLQTSQIVVGGSVEDWFKEDAGGVAPLGAFTNGAPNVGFVFSDDASGDTAYIGQAVAHEAGHTFGLEHHSTFKEDGSLDQEYDPGNPQFGPIMGFPFGERMLWANTAANIDGKRGRQDDLAILSGAGNGFGYRFDDYGGTRQSSLKLFPTNGVATVGGVIEQVTDVDAFTFSCGAGTVKLELDNAQYAAMLDGTIKLINPFGNVLAQAATANLDETISVTVPAGTYTVLVSSAGQYGDLGQYTLKASIPGGSSITSHYLVEGTDLADVISVNLVEGSYKLDINGAVQTLDPDTVTQFDILGGDGNDTITIGPGVPGAYVLAGGGADTIYGDAGKDSINGSGGNDLIFGADGDDRLTGGAGHDIIVCGNGRDRAYGEAGNDVITGGAGVDRLFGGGDNDVLSGESSADKMYGEAGNDSIYGGNGTDLLNGGDGLDNLYAGADNDVLYARDNGIFDVVNGGTGDDKAETEDADVQQSLEELLA